MGGEGTPSICVRLFSLNIIRTIVQPPTPDDLVIQFAHTMSTVFAEQCDGQSDPSIFL